MFALYLTVALIAVVSQTECFVGPPARQGPYPICEECRDPDVMIAPGIGFDLTHSYGTAAVRYQNGSVAFIGKVGGDDAFISLMMRNSFESSRPKEPKTVWEKLRYAWERAKRKRNKDRGLPATEDVGTIANILVQLRNVSELHLDQNITAAVTAIPYLPGLTREDLEDAMEYAGLKMLRGYNLYRDLDEVRAAYAGLGNGLCHEPQDIKSCEDEEVDMRDYQVLSISFTDWMLSLTLSVCYAAHQCWDYSSEHDVDLGMRFEHCRGLEPDYWTRVRRAIRRFAELAWHIDKLQLFGEGVANEHFKEALRGALRDLEPRTGVVVNVSERVEPLGLVARGAAEFAKRFQEMTWGCQEPSRCNETEMLRQPVAEL